MPVQTLDGIEFRKLLENGYKNLKVNMSVIDELNVFPVPDGDTGKNMTMTIEGGVTGSSPDTASLSDMMRTFSRSALLSARGNSGVILSQYISGISDGFAGKDSCSVNDFLRALESGVKKAYDSVLKPVEGTMLTVVRQTAEALRQKENGFADFESCLEYALRAMKKSLAGTPDLLPVLKEAGVIDSGGAGVVCIFEGMLMELEGKTIDLNDAPLNTFSAAPTGAIDPEQLLVYGYCCEFILQLQQSKTNISDFDINSFISHIETLGTSIVAVRDGSIVKVHIHSFEPEKVIEFARKHGEFITVKIENMSVQHNETQNIQKKERQKYAVVASVQGEGAARCFREIGAAAIIDGGQTNNPSAQAFLDAFEEANADNIIVLPNNSNIVLTAQQAAEMYKGSMVKVIPTKSICEGYSALSMADYSFDTVDEVISEMTYYLPNVTTCYVTTATRDAKINGVDIEKGKFIGLTDDTILSCSDDMIDASFKMLAALDGIDDKQIITVFYGKDITKDDLGRLEDIIHGKFPLFEIGFLDGGQDVYPFIFSVE